MSVGADVAAGGGCVAVAGADVAVGGSAVAVGTAVAVAGTRVGDEGSVVGLAGMAVGLGDGSRVAAGSDVCVSRVGCWATAEMASSVGRAMLWGVVDTKKSRSIQPIARPVIKVMMISNKLVLRCELMICQMSDVRLSDEELNGQRYKMLCLYRVERVKS